MNNPNPRSEFKSFIEEWLFVTREAREEIWSLDKTLSMLGEVINRWFSVAKDVIEDVEP